MAQTLEQTMLKKLETIPNEVSLSFFRISIKFGKIALLLTITHRTLRSCARMFEIVILIV